MQQYTYKQDGGRAVTITFSTRVAFRRFLDRTFPPGTTIYVQQPRQGREPYSWQHCTG